MSKRIVLDRYIATNVFMYNNLRNSLKILAGSEYKDDEWFIYTVGKQTMQCKVITKHSKFIWADV